jgi:glutathione peroxidase
MSFFDFKVKTIDGEDLELSQLKGKKVLVVNTASECGLTPQYEQLEALYQQFADQCEVIGFPCNDFGAQEPGSNEQIKSFCTKNYGVSFSLMDKISVKGTEIHPLYKWLLDESKKKNQLDEVKWNFQKFLINEAGEHVKTIEPTVEPLSSEIVDWIQHG